LKKDYKLHISTPLCWHAECIDDDEQVKCHSKNTSSVVYRADCLYRVFY